jgi:hypothetical protein
LIIPWWTSGERMREPRPTPRSPTVKGRKKQRLLLGSFHQPISCFRFAFSPSTLGSSVRPKLPRPLSQVHSNRFQRPSRQKRFSCPPEPLPVHRLLAANMSNPFQVEAWSEYSVGMVIILVRIFARCRQIGRNWEGDDWFALISIVFWTVSKDIAPLVNPARPNLSSGRVVHVGVNW